MVRERDVTTEAMSEKCKVATFEDGERGSQAKERGQPLAAAILLHKTSQST